MEKKCLECGSLIRGRVDKKFCSDSCRNSFNNKLYRESTEYVRIIYGKLRKNRRILCSLFSKKNFKVHKDTLNALGYDFRFFSHIIDNNGIKSHYCFEYGLDIGSDNYYELRFNDNLFD